MCAQSADPRQVTSSMPEEDPSMRKTRVPGLPPTECLRERRIATIARLIISGARLSQLDQAIPNE